MPNYQNKQDEKFSSDELLIGRNPIIEALSSGRSIIKVMVAKGVTTGPAVEIAAKARKAGVPVQEAMLCLVRAGRDIPLI